jgi:glutamyl/glutaminyl-tRNA synthetase
LKAFNAHYLRSRPDTIAFENYIAPFAPKDDNISYFKKDGVYDLEFALNVEKIAKDRSVFGKEMYAHVSYFFEPIEVASALKNDFEFRTVMNSFANNPCNRVLWNTTNLKSVLEGLCERSGIKMGKIMPDLRTALSGGKPGPDLPLTMVLLGPDETFKRISDLLLKTEKVAG